MFVIGLVVGATGCPGDDAPDDDVTGPRPNTNGRDPFEIVDAGTNAPERPVCIDDGAEDNDTVATATAITSGEVVTARACDADVDWYALDLAGRCTVAATLTLVAPTEGTLDPLADLDLVIVNAATGVVVGTGGGVGPGASFDVITTTSGRYAVRVDGGRAGTDLDYTLVVTASCQQDTLENLSCPADDRFEDNDTVATATVLDRNSEVFGRTCDDDYFRYAGIGPGCTLAVTARFTHSLGDLDLQLLVAGSQVTLAQSSSNDETATFVPTSASDVTARVYGYQGAQNTYALTATTTCP